MGIKEVSKLMYLQSKRCDKFLSPLMPGAKLCKRCVTSVMSLLKDIEVTDVQQLSGSSASGSEPDYLQQLMHDAGGSVLNVIMPTQHPEVI
jgi:fructose-1-phosphate kinase PfkB-like protein